MANNKSKKTDKKKSSTKPKSADAKTTKSTKAEEVATKKETTTVTTTTVTTKKNPLKGFFARKYDEKENILTIFKSPRIWGAVAGELVGTMLLSIILLTLGIYQPLYVMFGLIAITMAVYAFSGAHLNPLVTAGMMATRRVSAIRGVIYIVAQVVGAWLGLLIVNAFRLAGQGTVDLPTMTALTGETVGHAIFIELVGAAIIGFFFARAQAYRTPRGAFTYAALIGGGTVIAILFGIVVSSNFLGLQNNFAMNPAMAIMYQIFPTSAENFGALIGDLALAVVTYILIPMLGGILGFFIADTGSKLSEE